MSLQVLASDKGEIPQNSTTFVDIVVSNSSVTKIWPSGKNNPDQIIDDNTRTDALINTVSFGTTITGARLIVKCQSSEMTDKFKISVPASDNRKFELHAAGDFDDEKDTKVVQIRVYTVSSFVHNIVTALCVHICNMLKGQFSYIVTYNTFAKT